MSTNLPLTAQDYKPTQAILNRGNGVLSHLTPGSEVWAVGLPAPFTPAEATGIPSRYHMLTGSGGVLLCTDQPFQKLLTYPTPALLGKGIHIPVPKPAPNNEVGSHWLDEGSSHSDQNGNGKSI